METFNLIGSLLGDLAFLGLIVIVIVQGNTIAKINKTVEILLKEKEKDQ